MKEITNSTDAVREKRERRYFSESARRAIVKEIEEGLSKAEASRRYEVSQAALYKWMARYSSSYSKALVRVVEHESDSLRARRLEQDLKEAYSLLGRKSAEVFFLEELLRVAGEHYGVDIKKNFGAVPCSGSIPKKGAGV
jgi:transposase